MNTILLRITNPINEADGRVQGRSGATGSRDYGPNGMIDAYDWRLYNGAGFGRQLQSLLGGGNGYSYEVTDMGKYVSVRGTYHNLAKGTSRSKVFVVAFEDPKIGDGKVFATSTKWRTISNVGQAANYIKSTIQSFA